METINGTSNFVWHDAAVDQPQVNKEILVIHEGKVAYGVYLGDYHHLYGWERGRYVYEHIEIKDGIAQSYVITSNFSDNDKWAYMDDFLPNSNINGIK